MDQAEKDRIQHELDDEAKRLFPGVVREVAILQHGDDPQVEPGELMVRLTGVMPSDDHEESAEALSPKKPEMKEFRHKLTERLPEVRRIEIKFQDPDGKPLKMHRMMGLRGPDKPPDGDFTPVMARLRPADLEVVDTLISAGIAANRAEAVRWALARVSERPAYTELLQHTRDIERLKTEF